MVVIRNVFEKNSFKGYGVSVLALASLLFVIPFFAQAETLYETPPPTHREIMEDETFTYPVPNGVVWDRIQVNGYPFTINRAEDAGGATSCTQTTVTEPDFSGYTTLVCNEMTSSGSVEITFSYGATSSIAVYNEEGIFVPWIKFCNDECTTDGPDQELDFSLNYDTRFTGFTATGTAGVIEMTADYFIDATEIRNNVSAYNPTIVHFRYANRASSTSEFGGQGEFITDFDGEGSVTTIIADFEDGTYDIQVIFSNFACSTGLGDCPFAKSYIYTEITVEGGVVTNIGELELYDGTTLDNDSKYRPCGITTIDNCISNAFIFTFVPSEESVARFDIAQEQLQGKAPFIYLYQMSTMWDSMFNAPRTSEAGLVVEVWGSNLTLFSTEMVDDYPFYTGIIYPVFTAVMYILTAFYLYRRSLKVFNQDPQ